MLEELCRALQQERNGLNVKLKELTAKEVCACVCVHVCVGEWVWVGACVCGHTSMVMCALCIRYVCMCIMLKVVILMVEVSVLCTASGQR